MLPPYLICSNVNALVKIHKGVEAYNDEDS